MPSLSASVLISERLLQTMIYKCVVREHSPPAIVLLLVHRLCHHVCLLHSMDICSWQVTALNASVWHVFEIPLWHSALVSCIVCMLLYLLVCMLHLQVFVFKRASWRSVESIYLSYVMRMQTNTAGQATSNSWLGQTDSNRDCAQAARHASRSFWRATDSAPPPNTPRLSCIS